MENQPNTEIVSAEESARRREKELDAMLADNDLMEFMQAGLSNTGEEEPEEDWLRRGKALVDSFSEQPSDFWKFK